SEQRLKKGRENLVKYADIFKKAEETYGVPGPVIAAFWGLETDFGAIQGDFDTLNSLVSLSHDCRRPELFRPQLMAML
ncbi:lytic murein transglycosylase, partial [Ochrobactrum sp. GRS2]|nr:lytic murein transglycosylase [Ochrobactrum sp. GRS2]